MAKVDISKLTIEELVNYEKAAKQVCLRYENTIKNYDGSIRTTDEDYTKYEKYHKVYLRILSELESRISDL